MAVDVNAALKKYGFVGTLANTVPELKRILTQAAAGNWDTDRFSRAVQDSKWWKDSADSVKQYQILKATKPGEWHEQRAALERKAQTIASEMGLDGHSINSHILGHYVAMAQMHGWDDDTLRHALGRYLKGTGDYSGQAGELQQQVRQMYADYGVRYDANQTLAQVRGILSGRQTIQGVHAMITTHAKSTFPGLAAQIDAGHTVAEIASPYLATKAQLLEVPPTTITLQDAAVRKALSTKDPKTGAIGVMPLWQYEQSVKADPRWDKTKNAMNDYSQMAQQIGRDWGFIK